MVGIATAILRHYERWDGKEYPKGLVGEEIPILSRIMAVGASYDTILSERMYKKAKTKSEALKKLQNYAGNQFDPQIVSLFVNQVANTL